MSVLNILNMLYNLYFSSSKCRLFHNATLFGFCITHILNTGCAKIWKKVRRQKVKCVGTLGSHYVIVRKDRPLCSVLFCSIERWSLCFSRLYKLLWGHTAACCDDPDTSTCSWGEKWRHRCHRKVISRDKSDNYTVPCRIYRETL